MVKIEIMAKMEKMEKMGENNDQKNYGEIQVIRREQWAREKQQESLCGCSGIALDMDSIKKGGIMMTMIIMTWLASE